MAGMGGSASASIGLLLGSSEWATQEILSLHRKFFIPVALQQKYLTPITRDEFTTLLVYAYEYVKNDTTEQPTSFTDISGSDYKTEIEKAKTIGLIDGTSATKFTPQGLLTREQTAKLLYTMVEKIDGAVLGSGTPEFSDNAQISDWAVPYVAYVQENSIMQGSNGEFMPQGNLTCEEAMVVVERLIAQFGWEPWYAARGPLPSNPPIHPQGEKCLGIIEVYSEGEEMDLTYSLGYKKSLRIGEQFYYYGYISTWAYSVMDNGVTGFVNVRSSKVIKTF
ncbi:MAG: S-layer homology domain-containing protein [Oscillospiraceae bacterium]|nr:S-layer homology domain-containing protein [Oscillospiraceae bacterium]